ncbi:SNF2 domain-containing protein CLASSY 4-like [Abrus precatorius]|uniref:SNF2 domain-containing protein CLASSY 4-like n=1 Tax=Abrus precatorius TaxID=3816 RepID=A0A8B8JV82_ABRPR|nr:SNF2 domain-containing protein CLASSY 4-like [Abrus precatorius]
MDRLVPVSSRTRSKKFLNLLNVSNTGSSSTKRRMSVKSGVMAEKRKRRRMKKRIDGDDVVCLGENLLEEGASGKIESGSRAAPSLSGALKGKKVAEPDIVCLEECDDEESCEMIKIDDSDNGNDTEEGLRHSEKMFEVNVVVGVKEEEKSEEGKEDYVFGDKVENFGHSDTGCGGPEYPAIITIDSDGDGESEKEHGVGESGSYDEYDDLLSSTESEDMETSDEDFEADVVSEYSSSEQSDTSSDDDERESVQGTYSKMVKEQVRKVASEINEVFIKKGERKVTQIKEEERERTPTFINDNDSGEQDHDQWISVDCASVTSSESEIHEEEAKNAAEKHEANRGEKPVENFISDVKVFGEYMKNTDCSMRSEDEALKDKEKQDRDHQSIPLTKETGDSTMVKKNEKNNDANENANPSFSNCVNLDAHEEKGHHHDKVTCVRSVSSLPVVLEKIGDSPMVMKSEKNHDVSANASTGNWVNLDAREGKKHHRDTVTGLRSVASLRKDLEKIGVSVIDKKSEKNNDANANTINSVNLDAHEGKEHDHDKVTGVRSVASFPKDQEKIEDSVEVKKENKKEWEHKDRFDSNNREKKVRVMDNESGYKDKQHVVPMMSSRTKEQRLIKLLAECFWGKHDSVKDVDSNGLKEKEDDVDPREETQPPACRETVPLNWTLKKVEPIEKSESEKELDMLWEEMEMLLRLEEINSQVGSIGTNEARENQVSLCKHDFYLDEQIGILCRLCLWVATEIKYVTPPFVDEFHSEGSGKRVSSGGGNTSHIDGVRFNDSGGDSEAVWSHNEGTVWDLIPDIKESLYPHQQEGFEFIWTRLAGTIDLCTLKNVDPCSEGGCIISHAPGTGKTRLTMVFLQTYLQVFPKCLPVIIAPANLLLTWEDELRKWDIGIPFHNFNNPELSGKENVDAAKELEWSRSLRQNKDAIRMLKLCSWYKEKSILLISYHLYEKLAGGMSEVDDKKGKKRGNMQTEKKRARSLVIIESEMGKVLRDYPGLLVLDEGHTPRNQRSCIWKVLSESRTQKRILLSGTPFQNNFLELYNILCLMKPSFPDSIPQELKKFCLSRLMHEKKAPKDVSWEPVSSANPADHKINQLKFLMDPFVHVHKGSILKKNLPGLRDCVLILKPDSLQQEILESIEGSQNILNFEHKLALVSVHPSLFLKCSLTEKEESVIDGDQLEKLRLDPYGGVKTKFLMEFVRLCDAYNEKIIVFSQYIDTLCLIKDQLGSAFNWSDGKEVLYMYGRLDQKQKQFLIHHFNDANSQAKILLASIKACSEGINLIGASRVVLLDVVWNPSVERQAICRAYRLGQKKVVYTYHLLAQGTTECTKYCKQAQKDRLSELVFSDRNNENDKPKSCPVTFEDSVLDHMVQHEKLKDMFSECVVHPREKDLENFGP